MKASCVVHVSCTAAVLSHSQPRETDRPTNVRKVARSTPATAQAFGTTTTSSRSLNSRVLQRLLPHAPLGKARHAHLLPPRSPSTPHHPAPSPTVMALLPLRRPPLCGRLPRPPPLSAHLPRPPILTTLRRPLLRPPLCLTSGPSSPACIASLPPTWRSCPSSIT
jgi:hypothetical protein